MEKDSNLQRRKKGKEKRNTAIALDEGGLIWNDLLGAAISKCVIGMNYE